MGGVYVPRAPTSGVLYGVVRTHLAEFLREVDVDHVIPPDVPVRQWVLSVPHRLRYRLAHDHRLCRAVLGVFVRALRGAYRRQARREGVVGGETGMVTAVQRFGGSANLHVHFHTLVAPPPIAAGQASGAGGARAGRDYGQIDWPTAGAAAVALAGVEATRARRHSCSTQSQM